MYIFFHKIIVYLSMNSLKLTPIIIFKLNYISLVFISVRLSIQINTKTFNVINILYYTFKINVYLI